MSLTLVPAAALIGRLAEFDTVIDARSEDEFALDHLPGALSWPTLNNAERIFIGTTYKQVNAFEAKKRGAALAAKNIAAHIEREVIDKAKTWKPLCYCWRGGKRSGSLALILDQIGFKVTLVEGGYKAFRAAMVLDTARLVSRLNWQVVCGTTGSGKTRLLQALALQGAQVLDLEALANHRSSVLGGIPGVAQPSQKRFDMLVWDKLRGFDPARPVFVESESKKVGNVAIAQDLMDAMRDSPCLNLVLHADDRVKLLLEDYQFFVDDTALFCDRLAVLTVQRGKAVVSAWQASVHAGDIEPVVRDLLTQHYDPVYLQSIERNFSQYSNAPLISPANHSLAAFSALAGQLLGEGIGAAPTSTSASTSA